MVLLLDRMGCSPWLVRAAELAAVGCGLAC